MLRVVEEGSQPGARARFDRVACGRSCECETHWYGDTCEINLNHKMGDARPLQYYEDEDEVEEEAPQDVAYRTSGGHPAGSSSRIDIDRYTRVFDTQRSLTTDTVSCAPSQLRRRHHQHSCRRVPLRPVGLSVRMATSRSTTSTGRARARECVCYSLCSTPHDDGEARRLYANTNRWMFAGYLVAGRRRQDSAV